MAEPQEKAAEHQPYLKTAEAQPQRSRPSEANKAAGDKRNLSDAEPETQAAANSPEDSEPERPPGKPFYKRPLLMAVLVVVTVVVVVVGIAYWLYARQYEWTDDAFIDGHVVQISPKIAGYVVALNVSDNALVHEGDVLLEIDPRDANLALANARAAEVSAAARLKQTAAQITTASAEVRAAEADQAAAEATAANALRQRERNERLAPKAVSQEVLDNSITAAKSATAQVTAAQAKTAAARSQVELALSQRTTAEATLREAQVEVEIAELNHSYSKIVAPITGRVTHRSVELGDYVRPGQALFAVVDPRVWVTANFKETQLERMRVGQAVRVRVDAYSKTPLSAHVDSFQRGSGARFSLLPAENATGNYVKIVQRVPVKIVFDEPPPNHMILGPGMSVVPRVSIE